MGKGTSPGSITLHTHAIPVQVPEGIKHLISPKNIDFFGFLLVFKEGLFYLAPQGAHCLLHPPLEIFTKNTEISPKIRRFRNSKYLAGNPTGSYTKMETLVN
jgi:hypothetical protein